METVLIFLLAYFLIVYGWIHLFRPQLLFRFYIYTHTYKKDGFLRESDLTPYRRRLDHAIRETPETVLRDFPAVRMRYQMNGCGGLVMGIILFLLCVAALFDPTVWGRH